MLHKYLPPHSKGVYKKYKYRSLGPELIGTTLRLHNMMSCTCIHIKIHTDSRIFSYLHTSIPTNRLLHVCLYMYIHIYTKTHTHPHKCQATYIHICMQTHAYLIQRQFNRRSYLSVCKHTYIISILWNFQISVVTY